MDILSKLPKIVKRKAKRKGRGLGSGKGSKSGRGTTRHQKAREKIPLHFEGGQGRLVKRYPLLRGKGKNKSIVRKPKIIKLSSLEVFANDSIVDEEAIYKQGLSDQKTSIKILYDKPLSKKLTLKLKVSRSVKKAIEKVGGKVQDR